METNLPPYALGLPERYQDWRYNQWQMIMGAVECPNRVHAVVAATGSGKSLVYMAVGQYIGNRVCILTATKALQDQLARDFGSILEIVKGKQAYKCRRMANQVTCDQGLCNFGVDCLFKDSGCEYYDQLRRARRSKIVVTNYHFWGANNRQASTDAQEKIGRFGLLVCDEAHQAPEIMGEMFTVEFNSVHKTDREMMGTYPWGNDRDSITRWVETTINTATQEAKRARKEIVQGGQRYGMAAAWQWQDLANRAQEARGLLAQAADRTLVVEEQDRGKIRIAPIWPYEAGGRLLFADVPKVLMTSATVRPKTLGLLGLKDGDFQVKEYPHNFPAANRRLCWLPTVRVNYRTTKDEYRLWQLRIDQIVRTRMDRKGLIHSVSYQRANEIMRNSQHRNLGYLITHRRDNAAEAVLEFKRNINPYALVSPSVSTGYDFPGDCCRYQIITKIPYPDTSDALTAARCRMDEELAPYSAMTELVQTCGRPIRSRDDWAENFIIDDNIFWFLKRHNSFAPVWFSARQAHFTYRRDMIPQGRNSLTINYKGGE